jgi:hypothetical protein
MSCFRFAVTFTTAGTIVEHAQRPVEGMFENCECRKPAMIAGLLV